MANFTVTKIEKANKPNYMVAYVRYNSGKEYTFVRRNYDESIIIEGYRISFHKVLGTDAYIVDDITQEYETAGKKVQTHQERVSGNR